MYDFVFQVSETENIRKNLAIERMIVEGCDILLDVNQVFVRQGKKPLEALSSCFPKETVPSFQRRSIDFPEKSSHIFTSEDSEEATKYRSQRSHSTVSYLQREHPIQQRRRLSSLRQNSLGNGTSLGRHSFTLGTSPLSPPQQSRAPDSRRSSDVPKGRKKSVRISDESFDECEEIVVATAAGAASSSSPPHSQSSSPEEKMFIPDTRRLSSLTPVQERSSLDSGSSEDTRTHQS